MHPVNDLHLSLPPGKANKQTNGGNEFMPSIVLEKKMVFQGGSKVWQTVSQESIKRAKIYEYHFFGARSAKDSLPINYNTP